MQCEFCGADAKPLYTVTCWSASATLFRCTQCHSCHSHPEFPPDLLRSFYRTAYFEDQPGEILKARVLARDYRKKVLPYLKELRDRSGVALEIGAGYGLFAQLVEKKDRIPIDIVEPNESCRRYISNHLRLRARIVPDIADLPKESKYDAIFLFHVAEHLQRFSPFLKQIVMKLKPRGRIYILTPNADSHNFLMLDEQWGWACPNQHFLFLSQNIPEVYFLRFGLKIVLRKDLHPAPIHYPSVWHVHVNKFNQQLNHMIPAESTFQTILLKILRRVGHNLARELEQNRRAYGLLTLEKIWATLRKRRPRDELFYLLEFVSDR